MLFPLRKASWYSGRPPTSVRAQNAPSGPGSTRCCCARVRDVSAVKVPMVFYGPMDPNIEIREVANHIERQISAVEEKMYSIQGIPPIVVAEIGAEFPRLCPHDNV